MNSARATRAEEMHAARVAAAPPRHAVDFTVVSDTDAKKTDPSVPSGPVRAVAWGAPPAKTPSREVTRQRLSDDGRARRAETRHVERAGAAPPRLVRDWAVRRDGADVAQRDPAAGRGVVRWAPAEPSARGGRKASSSVARNADGMRAADAEKAAVARMRATEPRLLFDHCVVEAKSDLDAPRVRARGKGPPAQKLVKDSGRPRQRAAELAHLAAQMEAQGRVESARECLEKCISILEDVLGLEHPDVGKAVKSLADLLHSQFGKEGKREAIALYLRAADVAVLAYGYEHPVTVAALTTLEEVRRVKHLPPTRPTAGTHPRFMHVDHAHVQEKTDLGVPSRPVRAVRWKHPDPALWTGDENSAPVVDALRKYGYGYGGSVAARRNDKSRAGRDAEMSAKLHRHFIKTRIF